MEKDLRKLLDCIEEYIKHPNVAGKEVLETRKLQLNRCCVLGFMVEDHPMNMAGIIKEL